MSLMEAVIAIFNKCYKEFFANKVYFVAFALDPHAHSFFKSLLFSIWHPNYIGYPLAYFQIKSPTIILPAINMKNRPIPTPNNVLPPILYPNTYDHVKVYLKNMLHKQLACCEAHPNDRKHSIFREMDAAQIVDNLCHQMKSYWHNEYAFNIPVKDGNPLPWWKRLGEHVHVRVLAVQIMSSYSFYMY